MTTLPDFRAVWERVLTCRTLLRGWLQLQLRMLRVRVTAKSIPKLRAEALFRLLSQHKSDVKINQKFLSILYQRGWRRSEALADLEWLAAQGRIELYHDTVQLCAWAVRVEDQAS